VNEQLKKSIDSAKDHSHIFRLSLIHNWSQQLIDNEEPIVWHEKILDEYWNQIEEEWRKQKIVAKIESIQTLNVEITKERLAALAAMFLSGRATNSSKQQYFGFINANLCEEGIISLAKLVDVSSRLHRFRLQYNRINSMKSACCLSRSLKSHSCIENLHLAGCDLGSSPEILSVILQSDVSWIDLCDNNIDSLGAVKIAEYLESDPPIKLLSLHHNRLDDDDMILISQALKGNTNLTHLNLLGNNLTSTGVKAPLTCVFDSSSLNAISESNHTLSKIDFFDDGNNRPIKEMHNCINTLLGFDRTEKLLLALQEKDSLLQYLTNVPVGVIPDVLAFPHGRVVDEHQYKHLNIVYSIMRWWDMPMICLFKE
jgi:hypothetical protein